MKFKNQLEKFEIFKEVMEYFSKKQSYELLLLLLACESQANSIFDAVNTAI